jgi:hypothetical protein
VWFLGLTVDWVVGGKGKQKITSESVRRLQICRKMHIIFRALRVLVWNESGMSEGSVVYARHVEIAFCVSLRIQIFLSQLFFACFYDVLVM